MERPGFSAMIHAEQGNYTLLDCQHIYHLTEHEPQVIINPYNVWMDSFIMSWLTCVSQNCSSEDDCAFVVEVALNCQEPNLVPCQEPGFIGLVFSINNMPFDTPDCSYWHGPTTSNERVIVQCRKIVSGKVLLRWFRGEMNEMPFYSAISVRSLQWTDGEDNFYLVPNSVLLEAGKVFDYHLPSRATTTWLSLSLTYACVSALEAFGERHREEDCAYRMVVGPPDYHHLHPERHLFTFKDKYHFTTQYLESEIYSFEIPAGCEPAISLVHIGDPIDNDLTFAFEKQQEFCDGVAIITSHGYENPFEIFKGIDDYRLNRTITCSAFPVNIFLELIAVGNGSLSIEAYDKESRKITLCDLREELPTNCSASEITALKIYWESEDYEIETLDGCFIRVHVSRSFSPFTAPTSMPSTTTAHSLGLRPDALRSLGVLVLLSSFFDL